MAMADCSGDDPCQLEIQLRRFDKLMAEVMRKSVTRNSFLPWELEILVDIESIELDKRRRTEILKQYRRAVAKQMQMGPGPPMKLSRFLEIRAERRNAKLSQLKHPAA